MDCPAALPSASTRRRDARGDFLGNRRRVAIGPSRRSPERKVAGQGRSGNDWSALGISQRPWPAKTLILLLRRGFSGECEIAEIGPVHQYVFPVGATKLFLLMFEGFVFELRRRRDSNTKPRSA
jgi:hypothetical protein